MRMRVVCSLLIFKTGIIECMLLWGRRQSQAQAWMHWRGRWSMLLVPPLWSNSYMFSLWYATFQVHVSSLSFSLVYLGQTRVLEKQLINVSILSFNNQPSYKLEIEELIFVFSLLVLVSCKVEIFRDTVNKLHGA
jgi:hypothetical protein